MSIYSIGWCDHDSRGEAKARMALERIPALQAAGVEPGQLAVIECIPLVPEIKVFCSSCRKAGTLTTKHSDKMLLVQI